LRLNRFLARAGLGSRRGVEELIRAGRVTVSGEVVGDLGRRIDPATDLIAVDGLPVSLPVQWRVYAFHKPAGVVCTLKAQKGQPCLLPYREQAGLPARMIPVGRLDAETTGLLLWTDDGKLAQALCRPSRQVWKTYEVELDGPLPGETKSALAEGRLELDGRRCRPWRIEAQPERGRYCWRVALHEGRKRQIRRMLALGERKVVSLHRVGFGPISLGRLAAGDFRRLSRAQEIALRQAAGLLDQKHRSE